MKKAGLKSYQEAETLRLPRNIISHYLYDKKPIPLRTAIAIQEQFFPEYTLEYLFEHSATIICGQSHAPTGYPVKSVYPVLIVEMQKRHVSIMDMAALLNVSVDKMHAKINDKNGMMLSYNDANTIRCAYFEDCDLVWLFQLVPAKKQNT